MIIMAMRLVGDSVPMLINGVSQQSEVIRLPTQVSEQINCTSSIVQGLTKRPPSEFVKQLATSRDWSNAKVHLISRDENEQYILVIQSESIRVFDLEGNEHSVEMNGNQEYLTLDSGDKFPLPISAFRLHTVADTTFIVNRNIPVAMDETITAPDVKPYRALVWIKSAKAKKLHHIHIFAPNNEGRQLNINASYKPDADDVTDLNHSAQMLARDIKDALKAEDTDGNILDNWKVGTYTNIIYIESKKDDFTINVSNTWSDTYISSIKDTVGGVADLPSRAFTGMRLKVTGDVEDSEQGFWVKFVPDSESLEKLDTDGYNIQPVSATSIAPDEDGVVLDNKIYLPNHRFLGKTRTGDKDTAANDSGGERELVQWKEGSFAVPGLTDGEFYFVEVLTTAGVPTGYIQLGTDPSKDTDTVEDVEEADTDINLGASLTGIYDEDDASYKDGKLIRVRVLEGKWVESIAPSSSETPLFTNLDSSTMPHFLIRTSEVDSEGRFKFKLVGKMLDISFPLHKWGDRIVGDADSAPDPSFVGKTINDIFEWRQSLGFASGQNFILSERSQYFNFWPITVATSLEDARIDVAASGSNMSNFHSISVFQDQLVGFTNEGQFTLTSSGTTLTPETVNLSQTTKYESSETAQPINIGSSLAFPTSRGGFSAISEYFVREDQMAYVNENTRHIGHYIKGNVTNLSVSPISDSLVVQTTDDPKVLYFYQWFWKGNDKVQSAWSKWSFGSDIISANFVKDVLYLIMQDSNPELYKIVLTEGDIDVGGTYKTSLDRRVLSTNHSSSTISLPYTIEAGTMRVVDSDGRVLTIASEDGETITLASTIDPAKDIYIGEIYDSEVELTRPVVRTRYKENVDLRSRLQIHNYVLYHENTGYFKAKVYPKKYTSEPYEYEMDNVLGGTTLGTAPISSGSFKVPIRANARDMRLVIHNDSHFPHHLVSAEWSANYNPKVYRQ